MEKLKTLKTDLEEEILIITLNKAEKCNSLNIKTIHELRTVMQKLYDDPHIKAAIITGAGEEAFSLGEDPLEIQGLNELNGRKFAETGQETFLLIENCHKPIIAAINGYAIGSGCELTLACHLRIAVRNAYFSFPEVKRGIIPGFGGTQRLTHLLGKTKALELLITGDKLSSEEAEKIGLINHVVINKAVAIQKSKEILHKIIANAPLAVGALITCTNAAYNPDEDGYQTEANAFANCCKSDDLTEGINAFLEKREPKFEGI